MSLTNVFLHVFVFSPDEEVLNEEELDKEFLWNLQLLSEVIKATYCTSHQLTPEFP